MSARRPPRQRRAGGGRTPPGQANGAPDSARGTRRPGDHRDGRRRGRAGQRPAPSAGGSRPGAGSGHPAPGTGQPAAGRGRGPAAGETTAPPRPRAVSTVRPRPTGPAGAPRDGKQPARLEYYIHDGPMTVALTIDDGPSPLYTPQILQVLHEHGVTATFSMVGQNVAYYPRVAREVVSAGHLIANHTWSHQNLAALPAAAMRDQVAGRPGRSTPPRGSGPPCSALPTGPGRPRCWTTARTWD